MMDMLPQPGEGFEWVQTAAGPALICRPLERLAHHLFTTRFWRLGSVSGDRGAGWVEVASAMAVEEERLVRVTQVHGAAVFVAGPSDRPKADIILGRDPCTALAIQTADCVPLLICDRATLACAAVHAGWRGIAARAPQAGVEALGARFGCRPADLVAAIGPAIGACCYEVGVEVRAAFSGAFAADRLPRWFAEVPQPSDRNPSMPGIVAGRPEHWYFDGWTAVSDQLEEAGIPRPQIHIAALCTASHAAVFCSYRREGGAAGRLAAAIRPGPIAR